MKLVEQSGRVICNGLQVLQLTQLHGTIRAALVMSPGCILAIELVFIDVVPSPNIAAPLRRSACRQTCTSSFTTTEALLVHCQRLCSGLLQCVSYSCIWLFVCKQVWHGRQGLLGFVVRFYLLTGTGKCMHLARRLALRHMSANERK